MDNYNKSFSKKEYVIGRGNETEYYIITVKLSSQNYKLILLKNHSIIKESLHKGLTESKFIAFEWLLNFEPSIFKMNKVTMVHYKEDRPNANPWVKDTNIELHKNLNAYLLIKNSSQHIENKKDSNTIQEVDIVKNFEQQLLNIEEKEIGITEKEQIIKSRIGHSWFKNGLLKLYSKCHLCGVSDARFLIASHIKPWSVSSNIERLDLNNGLLLCPNHDKLFDNGYITFLENGTIRISPTLAEETKLFLNIREDYKITINDNKQIYMEWHRTNAFRDNGK